MSPSTSIQNKTKKWTLIALPSWQIAERKSSSLKKKWFRQRQLFVLGHQFRNKIYFKKVRLVSYQHLFVHAFKSHTIQNYQIFIPKKSTALTYKNAHFLEENLTKLIEAFDSNSITQTEIRMLDFRREFSENLFLKIISNSLCIS